MGEFQSNNTSGWVKFLTLPARRCENGNLIQLRARHFREAIGDLIFARKIAPE